LKDPKITQQIAEARDKGDLSENAEYDAAKEAQGMLEMRISKLKDTIATSKVIDESQLDTSKVSILCTVKLKNNGTKQSRRLLWYQIMRVTLNRSKNFCKHTYC
jgi:transcription elongation factor GreA